MIRHGTYSKQSCWADKETPYRMAGHDVLATTLRAIFYYLAQDLRILSVLRSEILNASRDVSLDELLPYQQLTRLPYL